MILNDNFLEKDIPRFHAISQHYDRVSYWKEQKRRCIEGYWVSGKWMPGALYFYCNFHTIRFEEEGSASRKIGRPWLRDIDWEKAYIYEEAMGFSGFSEDTLYTCDRKYGPEKDRAIRFGWITESDISKRIYIPAREYLRKIHPANLGKPLYVNGAKNVLDMEARGGGKQIPHSEIVMTPHGFITMGEVREGDFVIGANGLPTKVLNVFYQGLDDVYELLLQDGRSVRCGLEHQWEVFDGNNKRVLETKDLLRIGLQYKHTKNGKNFSRFKIRNALPTEYSEKDLLIDPYVLGVLLGDGTMTTITPKIASSDKFILDEVSRILEYKYEIKLDTSTTNNHTLKYIGDDKCRIRRDKIQTNPLHNSIVELGLNKKCLDKFIPDIYKIGSIKQRLSLLQGLLDTDGSITREGSIEFTNTNERLVDDVIYLSRSLGIQCRKGIDDRSGKSHIIKGHACKRGIIYRAYLRTDLPVFRLPRKFERIRKMKRSNMVYIVDIKKLDYKEESSCIMVDNEDHTYLVKDFIVTHNSYMASAMILHNFLFDGAYDYELYLESKRAHTPLTSDTVVGAIESKYSDDLLKKVKLAMEHLPDRQIINNETYPSPLFISYTGSLMSGKTLVSSAGSVINHRTFMDDPLAANGTRPNRAFLEEVGFMNNIIEVLGALESTQASADYKNLVVYGLGTGGLTTHGAVLHVKEIFNNPEEFNFLSFDDIWENKGKICFFLPGTHTINKFKKGPNKDTDEVSSRMYIEEEIEKAKNSGNRRRYMASIINMPLKPSDIFLTIEGNFFPMDDLHERLAEIDENKRILEASWKVQFQIKDGKSEWKMADKPILRDYPHRRGDVLDTAIEIWELPKTDASGSIPYGRYIASLDPVDNDGGDDVDHSLMSGFIMDSWTDKIVVEYTGRTKIANDFYEQWRRCLMYYNALCNYERNLKGFYGFMKNAGSLHLLCDEPEILKERGLSKGGGTGNQSKGTVGSTPIINWGLELILAWLESRAYTSVKNEDDETPDMTTNLQVIKSPALLRELISYNSEINTDRVSSLIYLMILREDRLNISKNSFLKKIEIVTSNKFWDKAYKNPNKKFYIQR